MKTALGREVEKLQEKKYKFNMMLLGPKGTGKSSFLKLFVAQFGSYCTKMEERAANNLPISDFDIGRFKEGEEYVMSKLETTTLS